MKRSVDDANTLFRLLNRRVADTSTQLQKAETVSVGCTRKRVVWTDDKTVLYRYFPLPFVQPSPARPILISFALVNRPYVLDLQPDRSLVRQLLGAGMDIYLIDWGNPDDADCGVGLEDYIERYLGGCVRHILDTHDTDALNLLGVCQGGTFSLCYCALHPQHIANLVTMVTPVDFHSPDDLLSKWVRELDVGLIAHAGNVPGVLLNSLFLALAPLRLMQHKYVSLLGRGTRRRDIETFVRMEKWISDNPDQAAAALAQFVKWFYQENRLIRGTLEIAGRRVDLRKIQQPVLNIYAARDHIVPASAAAALQRYIGSGDYAAHSVDTGHIGMYVSHRAQGTAAARIISWLQERS